MPVGDSSLLHAGHGADSLNKKTHLLPLLALVLLITAAILFWPAVFQMVIDPIARVFWLLARLFLMVDQEVYWILLIFAGFVLAAWMIPGRRDTYNPAYTDHSAQSVDRIESWKALLESTRDNPDSQAALQRRLEDLQATVYSLVDGDEPESIHIATERPIHQPGSLAALVGRGLPRRFRNQNKLIDAKLIASVDQIITSLETALEIRDDRTHEINNR